MKPRLKQRLQLVLVCYLAGLLVYLAICTVGLIRVGGLAPLHLQFSDFEAASISLWEEDEEAGAIRFAATDNDPQLIYSPQQAFYADRLLLDAQADRPWGEIVLYYTTKPGEPFSEAQKLWAQESADGTWYFNLGGRQLQALRIDPGSRGGVVWTFQDVTLNAPRSWQSHFLPDARGALALLMLPGLGAVCIYEVRAALKPLLVRRRFDRQAAQAKNGNAED